MKLLSYKVLLTTAKLSAYCSLTSMNGHHTVRPSKPCQHIQIDTA